MNDSQSKRVMPDHYPAYAQPGAHHLTPESIAATIADLRAIAGGTETIPFADRDHRTNAEVLALIIEHLSDQLREAYAEGREHESWAIAQRLTPLRTDALEVFSPCEQETRDAIEWYAASVAEALECT